MTLILKCNDCGKMIEHELPPNKALYYEIREVAARHERDRTGSKCMLSAARFIELVGVTVDGTTAMIKKTAAGTQ